MPHGERVSVRQDPRQHDGREVIKDVWTSHIWARNDPTRYDAQRGVRQDDFGKWPYLLLTKRMLMGLSSFAVQKTWRCTHNMSSIIAWVTKIAPNAHFSTALADSTTFLLIGLLLHKDSIYHTSHKTASPGRGAVGKEKAWESNHRQRGYWVTLSSTTSSIHWKHGHPAVFTASRMSSISCARWDMTSRPRMSSSKISLEKSAESHSTDYGHKESW